MMLVTHVDTQALIDQKIVGLELMVTRLESTHSKLNSSILELKTRRNLYAAISKLPAEIIVEIILEGKRHAHGQSVFAERSYLNLAGACRWLRAIALTAPHLWSSIDVTSVHPDGCLEMLRRSKLLPLHVRYAPQTHDLRVIQRYDAAASAVMSQIGRLRTLEITTAAPPFRYLPLPATATASSLQVLRLTCQNSGIFLGRCSTMPSLRILALHNVTLGPNFPPLPSSLTQLDIVSPPLPPFGGQPISQLLRCIQKNVPNIEIISIAGLVLDVPIQHPILAQKISLPNLSRLNIHSPNINASTIFDCLQHPSSTCIRFTCLKGNFQLADLASLKRVISHFAVRGAVSIIDASIAVTHDKQVEIIIDAFQPRVPLPKRFKLMFPFSCPDMVDMVIQLWTSIPPADAPSLTVSGFFVNDLSSEWLRLLTLFRGVEILRLRHCNEIMLRGLLGADDAESLPLPRLRKIYFHLCGCDGGGPRPHDAMWNVMRQLLSERSVLGIPVELYWDGVCISENAGKDSVSPDWDAICSTDGGKEVDLEHCITFI